jgi:hypothetical protein
MSKKALKAAQGSEATRADSVLDSYGPVDPQRRVIHEAQGGIGGTGPISLEHQSEADKRYFMAKKLLAGARGAGIANESNYGKVHADKKDIKLVADRIKNLQLAHKDEWISKHVDWTNPSSIAVWRQAAPDFWERRVDYLRKTIDVQGKLAMIVTKGFPTTPEEVDLLYMVDTGQLKVEPSAAHKIAVDAAGQRHAPVRGWMHQLLSADYNRPSMRDPATMIAGLRDPTDSYGTANIRPGYSRHLNALSRGAGAAGLLVDE